MIKEEVIFVIIVVKVIVVIKVIIVIIVIIVVIVVIVILMILILKLNDTNTKNNYCITITNRLGSCTKKSVKFKKRMVIQREPSKLTKARLTAILQVLRH